MKYSVNMKHISGKANITADALSRYPGTKIENSALQVEVEEFAKNLFIPCESQKVKYLINLQENDNETRKLKEIVKYGWKEEISEISRKYRNNQQYCWYIPHDNPSMSDLPESGSDTRKKIKKKYSKRFTSVIKESINSYHELKIVYIGLESQKTLSGVLEIVRSVKSTAEK